MLDSWIGTYLPENNAKLELNLPMRAKKYSLTFVSWEMSEQYIDNDCSNFLKIAWIYPYSPKAGGEKSIVDWFGDRALKYPV